MGVSLFVTSSNFLIIIIYFINMNFSYVCLEFIIVKNFFYYDLE